MQEARPWGPLNLTLMNLGSNPQSWGATESWGGNRVTESAMCFTKITLAEEERTDQSKARLREMKVMAQAQGKAAGAWARAVAMEMEKTREAGVKFTRLNHDRS